MEIDPFGAWAVSDDLTIFPVKVKAIRVRTSQIIGFWQPSSYLKL
jgi:hypothetical protein